jgi:hypothetical protein
MIWQDLVFSIGAFVLTIALIPTILGKEKPKLSTSAITATIITAFSFSYFTLGLTLSGLAAAINSVAWYILAFQSFRVRGVGTGQIGPKANPSVNKTGRTA